MSDLRSTQAGWREHPTVFWGALLVLNTLLLLPAFVAHAHTSTFIPIPESEFGRGWYDGLLYLVFRRPNQDVFRLCVDALLLATLVLLAARTRWYRPVLRTCAGLYLFLLIYELYDAVSVTFFHRSGLLYEDVQHLFKALYLLWDGLTPLRLLALIGGGLLLGGIGWLVPRLFALLPAGLRHRPTRRAVLLGSVALWPFVFLLWKSYGPAQSTPTVRTVTAKIVANAQASLDMHRTLTTLAEQPVDSLYHTYADLTLAERPTVYVIMIESYGKILAEHEELRGPYRQLMAETEAFLAADGWHAATRYSDAPVRGGRSWLSMSSVLTGLHLDNQSIFRRLQDRQATYPHLPRFFQRQGYHTFTLQPPNRARPGLPLANDFGFDTPIYYDHLDYEGVPFGLFLVPDQYSLNYAQAHVVAGTPEPYFFFFETVTTHAPWDELPPYVTDWRQLNTITRKAAPDDGLLGAVKRTYKARYEVEDASTATRFFDHIAYDVRVLREYLAAHAPANSLVVLLGDHQPPILPSTGSGTPIHVLSRDPALVDRFAPFGFTPGLTKPPGAPEDALTHAGLYPLLVHVLATHADSTRTPPPPRPTGVSLSILAQ